MTFFDEFIYQVEPSINADYFFFPSLPYHPIIKQSYPLSLVEVGHNINVGEVNANVKYLNQKLLIHHFVVPPSPTGEG